MAGHPDEPQPQPSVGMIVAVTVVTLLTATSVGALVAARHGRTPAPVASAPRTQTPPSTTPSTGEADAQLSAPINGIVWALVDYSSLYLSTDDGDHWQRRTLPANLGVRPSIAFLNSSEGWLLAPGSPTTECQQASAAVYQTNDGAMTWHQLRASGILDAQCKELIYFADPNHGFVTAWDDTHRPSVYRTNDGGVTWAAATLPDNPLFVTGGGGFTLRVGWIKGFGNDIYLEASGSQQKPGYPRDFIYVSTDGGATWTWKQKLASPYTYMASELRWLQLSPDVDESVNGGQAFGPYKTDFNLAPPFKAYFVSADQGYVVAPGFIGRTTDGGAHWEQLGTPWSPSATPSPVPTPTGITLPTDVQLSSPSANVVWALVASGRLFRSDDRGMTWQERPWVPYQGGGGRPVISFVDDLQGWALFPGVPATQCLQASAQLWRTSDAGAHWSLVDVADQTQSSTAMPFDQCKDYVAFMDATNGFVAGHDTLNQPIISRTFNAGVTWARSSLPDPPGFVRGAGNTLQVGSISRFGTELLALAYAPNTAQYVYDSKDGGATWSFAAPVNANPDVPVAFVTATRWLVIENDGSGSETIDAGKTWHAFSSDYGDAAGVPSSFVFATALIGYGTVRGGIQVTADGGRHWTRLRTPGT